MSEMELGLSELIIGLIVLIGIAIGGERLWGAYLAHIEERARPLRCYTIAQPRGSGYCASVVHLRTDNEAKRFAKRLGGSVLGVRDGCLVCESLAESVKASRREWPDVIDV